MDKEEGLGWTLEMAKNIAEEYRKYLTLCLEYPDEAIVPSGMVDDFGICISWIRRNTRKIVKISLVIFYTISHISVCAGKKMPIICAKHGKIVAKNMKLVSASPTRLFGRAVHIAPNAVEVAKITQQMNIVRV